MKQGGHFILILLFGISHGISNITVWYGDPNYGPYWTISSNLNNNQGKRGLGGPNDQPLNIPFANPNDFVTFTSFSGSYLASNYDHFEFYAKFAPNFLPASAFVFFGLLGVMQGGMVPISSACPNLVVGGATFYYCSSTFTTFEVKGLFDSVTFLAGTKEGAMNLDFLKVVIPIVGSTGSTNGGNTNNINNAASIAANKMNGSVNLAAILVPVLVVVILVGVIVAFFVIRKRKNATLQGAFNAFKKIPSLSAFKSNPTSSSSNIKSSMVTPLEKTKEMVVPTNTMGASPNNSKQTTSVLMGFSATKNELPLIADYREPKIETSGTVIYGAPLSFCSKVGKVPMVIEECVKYLEINGLTEEGLLRMAGSSSETKSIKETFNQGKIPDFSKYNDINSIGDALKLYLRSLPQKPLLMTKGIKEASTLKDKNQMTTIMADELNQIPEVNYYALKRLFGLMRSIANNANITLMSPENIAIVFHPNLEIPQNIISLLITHPQVWVK